MVDFKGQKRMDATHESTTDEPELARKCEEAKLSYGGTPSWRTAMACAWTSA